MRRQGPLRKRKRPDLGPAALRDREISQKPKIVRPQYEAGAIYEDFVFFFGAFFFFVAMVLFLDV